MPQASAGTARPSSGYLCWGNLMPCSHSVSRRRGHWPLVLWGGSFPGGPTQLAPGPWAPNTPDRSVRFSHLWGAMCDAAPLPGLVALAWDARPCVCCPTITRRGQRRSAPSRGLRGVCSRGLPAPGGAAGRCFSCFLLPELALPFSHFRLAQSLEKTLFSGNPILTFLSNVTVTAGKCVVSPSLHDEELNLVSRTNLLSK